MDPKNRPLLVLALLTSLWSARCLAAPPPDHSATNSPLAGYAQDGYVSPDDYQRFYFNQELLKELAKTNVMQKLTLETDSAGRVVLVIPPALLTNAGLRAQIEMSFLRQQHLEETNKGFPLIPSQAFEDAKTKFGSPATTGKFLNNFLIRASYEDATAAEDQTLAKAADSFKSANPGIVSFARNYLSNSNQWIMKAAILYPFTYPAGSPLHFVPSVSLDREFNNHTDQEVDSLIFRIGAYSDFNTGPWNHSFRLYADYATDFEFRSSIPAAELDYEPTLGRYGDGVFYDLLHWRDNSPMLSMRYSGYLHQEYGVVSSSGGKPQLAGTTDFYRLGPAFKLALNPFFFDRLSVLGTYEYLYGAEGNPAYSHDFKVQANFNIDPQGHYTLNASYEDGSTPIVKDAIQTFLIGFGFKF